MEAPFEIGFDDLTPQGKPLPGGKYLVDVYEAMEEETEQGNVRVMRQYGNIRLPGGEVEFTATDGSTYHIGDRRLFARSWWTHTNEQANAIGHKELGQEAVAAGLMEAPVKGEPKKGFPFATAAEYAEALRGKTLLVTVRQKVRTRKLADGTKENVLDEETQQPIVDSVVVRYQQPEG